MHLSSHPLGTSWMSRRDWSKVLMRARLIPSLLLAIVTAVAVYLVVERPEAVSSGYSPASKPLAEGEATHAADLEGELRGAARGPITPPGQARGALQLQLGAEVRTSQPSPESSGARIHLSALWDRALCIECEARLNEVENLDISVATVSTPETLPNTLECLATIQAAGHRATSRVVQLRRKVGNRFVGELRVTLKSAASAACGIVVFPDGTPVAGCDIGAFDLRNAEPSAWPVRTTVSGRDGKFVVEVPEQGESILVAVLRDWRPSTVHLRGNQDLRLVLDSGETISGLAV